MQQNGQHNVIILENKKDKKDYLRSLVAGWGHRTFIFDRETVCLDNIATLEPDLIISGSLSIQRTCRFIHTLKVSNRNLPIVVVTDDQDIIDFVGHNGFKAVSVIEPGVSPVEMQSVLNRAIYNHSDCDELHECPLIVGNSPEMVRIKKLIANLNPYNETILLQGELGTGKELIARAIHGNSERGTKPFVKLHAPDLSRRFLAHEQTDNIRQSDLSEIVSQDDLISALDNGTLYVEEIGDLHPSLQARFLQLFEDEKFLASSNNLNSLHMICSTSSPLEMLAKRGKFRQDLYYRLKVLIIEIPPLRKRMEDIPLLTDFFTDSFCIEFRKSHFELSAITNDVFCNYLWAGNVQELKDAIRKIVLFDNEKAVRGRLTAKNKRHLFIKDFDDVSKLIGISDLKKHIGKLNKTSLKDISRVFMERAEKGLIEKALEHTNWNRKKAAKILDISYKSLLNKIKQYQLT